MQKHAILLVTSAVLALVYTLTADIAPQQRIGTFGGAFFAVAVFVYILSSFRGSSGTKS